MISMAKKSSTKPLNVHVPEALFDDLDGVVERLGLVKKRTVAAAVSAFLHADVETQLELYREVYRRYYASGEPAGATPSQRQAAEAAELGRRLRRGLVKADAIRKTGARQLRRAKRA